MYLQAAHLLTGWQPNIGLNVAHTRSIPMSLPTAGEAIQEYKVSMSSDVLSSLTKEAYSVQTGKVIQESAPAIGGHRDILQIFSSVRCSCQVWACLQIPGRSDFPYALALQETFVRSLLDNSGNMCPGKGKGLDMALFSSQEILEGYTLYFNQSMFQTIEYRGASKFQPFLLGGRQQYS